MNKHVLTLTVGLLVSAQASSLLCMEKIINQSVSINQAPVRSNQEERLHNLYVDLFGLEMAIGHHGNTLMVPQRFQKLSLLEAMNLYKALTNHVNIISANFNEKNLEVIETGARMIAKMQAKKEQEDRLRIGDEDRLSSNERHYFKS